MAIGINDLNDDLMDDVLIPNNQDPDNNSNQDNNVPNNDNNKDSHQENEDEDVITALLKEQNITDRDKIQYEDENGQIQELPFDSLPLEDQLNILKGTREDTHNDSDDLDEDEIQLINYLRSNNLTTQQYADYIAQEAIKNYQQEQPVSYKVDELSDDDLYLLDLKSRVPDIDDETAAAALDSAKQNESLFSKQVEGIRSEYQQKEIELAEQEQAQKQAQDSEQLQQFQEAIISSINNLDQGNDFAFNLSNADKQELYNFMFQQDATGMSYLNKAINDPQTLTKMSWYALHGDEAIDNMRNYYEHQMTEIRRTSYAKGLEDGKSGKKTVIFGPNETRKTGLVSKPNKYKNIYDLQD